MKAYDEKTYSKQLKDFPLVMKAFKEIQYDSCGSMAGGIRNDEAVGHWALAFHIAEQWLKKLNGKTIGQVCPELVEMEYYEGINNNDKAVEFVYLGMNDSAQIILRAADASEQEIWIIEHLFNMFFDGELTERFQNPPKIPGGRRTRRDQH